MQQNIEARTVRDLARRLHIAESPVGTFGESGAYMDGMTFLNLQEIDASLFSGDCFDSLYPVAFMLKYSERWARESRSRLRGFLKNDLVNPPYAPKNWSDVGVDADKVFQYCHKCGTGEVLEPTKRIEDVVTRSFMILTKVFGNGWTVEQLDDGDEDNNPKICVLCPGCSG